MILKDFFTSFIVESKMLRNHWLRNYFVKFVGRGECKIIWTRLTMFGRQIVEFLHKRTHQIFFSSRFWRVGKQWFLSLMYIFQFSLRKEKKNCVVLALAQICSILSKHLRPCLKVKRFLLSVWCMCIEMVNTINSIHT